MFIIILSVSVLAVVFLGIGYLIWLGRRNTPSTPLEDGNFTRPNASFVEIRAFWTPDASSSINELVGNHKDPTNYKALLKQLRIISSEVKELFDAITKGDIEEFRNALADILFTVHGYYHRSGYTPERDRELIFSDLFTTKEAIEPTYILEGIKAKLEYFEQHDALTENKTEEMFYNVSALEEDVFVLAYSLNILEVVAGDYTDVCQEQFSKFDTTKADSLLSKLKFDNLGVETTQKQVDLNGTTYWVTLSAKDQLLNGEAIVAGKWLKGHNHKVPVHAELGPDATGSILSVINAYQDLQQHLSVAEGYNRDAFVAAFLSVTAGVVEFELLEHAVAEYVGNNVEAVRAKVSSLIGENLPALINALNAGPGTSLVEDLAPLFVTSESVEPEVSSTLTPTFEEQKAKYLQALESAIRTVVASFPGVELVSFNYPEVAYSAELSEHQEELVNEAIGLVRYEDYLSKEYFQLVLDNGLLAEDLTEVNPNILDPGDLHDVQGYQGTIYHFEQFLKSIDVVTESGLEESFARSLNDIAEGVTAWYVLVNPLTQSQREAFVGFSSLLSGYSRYVRVAVNPVKNELILTQADIIAAHRVEIYDSKYSTMEIPFQENEEVLFEFRPGNAVDAGLGDATLWEESLGIETDDVEARTFTVDEADDNLPFDETLGVQIEDIISTFVPDIEFTGVTNLDLIFSRALSDEERNIIASAISSFKTASHLPQTPETATIGLDETPLEPIPEFESLVESVKQNLTYVEESSSNEFPAVEPEQIATSEIFQSVSSAGIVEDYGSLTTEETYRTDDNQSVN